MKIPLNIFLLASLFFSSCRAQSLSKSQVRTIHDKFLGFLIANEDMKIRNRPSEFIIALIDFDSLGKANNLRFLIEDQLKDSTYSILKRFPISSLNQIKLKEKDLTVIIPIISEGSLKNEKFKKILTSFSSEQLKVLGEFNKVILLSALVYTAPKAVHDVDSHQ